MRTSKSSNLWVDLKSDSESGISDYMGPSAKRIANENPLYFAMYAARYKFVARMVAGLASVVEVGSGDGFGASFISSVASRTVCIDIDPHQTEDCRHRFADKNDVKFVCHDLVLGPANELSGQFDAIAMVDVLEHIYPDEEGEFLTNSFALLTETGFGVVGTPNVEASRFASENSKRSHVNLHSAESLRRVLRTHFNNVLIFGMNDEVVHTGFHGMSHYLWAIAFGQEKKKKGGA